MQVSDAASRRFFGAFYTWTRLISATRRPRYHHPPSCHFHRDARGKEQLEYFTAFDELYRSAEQPGPVRSQLSSSTTSNANKHLSSPPRRRLSPALRPARRTTPKSTPIQPSASAKHRSKRSHPSEADFRQHSPNGLRLRRLLLELHPWSEGERPFHGIRPLTGVLRSRSRNSFELDCAIPVEWDVGFIDWLTGPDSPCGDDYGVQFLDGTRTVSTDEDPLLAGATVRAVRISGNQTFVEWAMARLFALCRPFKTTVRDYKKHPLNHRSLPAWTVRYRSKDKLTLDSSITEKAWSHADDDLHASFRAIAANLGVDLHLHEATPPPVGGSAISYRPITLSGSLVPVVWVAQRIGLLKASMKKKVEHESIADQANNIQPGEHLSDQARSSQDRPDVAEQQAQPVCDDSSSDDAKLNEEARTQDESGKEEIRPGRPLSEDTRLGEEVRLALRLLTQPVVLITTLSNSRKAASDPHLRDCRGVTVSSFNAVTLHPAPIISFNLKLPSRSYNIMSHTMNRIRIHILDATPQGAAIAHAFTRPYDRAEEPFQDLINQGISVELRPHPSPPLISQMGGVLAHLDAKLGKRLEVGDHIIITAEVLQCESLHHGQQQGAAGLSYAAQAYRARGEHVPPAFLPATVGAPVKQSDSSPGSPSAKTGAGSSHNTHASPRQKPLFPTAPQHRALAVPNATAAQIRSYSTTPALAQVGRGPTADDNRDAVEPAARKMTVAEFFNIPEDKHTPWRFAQFRSLLRAQKTVRETAKKLKAGSAAGIPHTHEQIQQLENELRSNQHTIDRALSKTAARSLRLMLDRGRVDFRRAQWLESSIERGQELLAEEMKQVDSMFVKGQMDKATFKSAKQHLDSLYDSLVTETMRLRQIVDEEGDGPAFDAEETTER